LRRLFSQQSEETADLIVRFSGLANDERRGHGPGDDRAGRDGINRSLTAPGAALAAALDRPADRFLIIFAGPIPGLGLFLGCFGGGFLALVIALRGGATILRGRRSAFIRRLCPGVDGQQNTKEKRSSNQVRRETCAGWAVIHASIAPLWCEAGGRIRSTV
jgi:hypothetical protein